jgi:hypothetical protein
MDRYVYTYIPVQQCVLVEGEGWMERVKEGEYGWWTLYTCMKIEQWNWLKLF